MRWRKGWEWSGSATTFKIFRCKSHRNGTGLVSKRTVPYPQRQRVSTPSLCEISLPSNLSPPDLEVHLPGLRQAPDMFDRQAEASRRCRDYAEDAYSAMDGPGPFRNAATGIINIISGTHNRIRNEVTAYFDQARKFGGGQSEKIREAIALYESTDMEIAAMLDASLYLPERREEVQDLGRSEVVEPDRETVGSMEPREPGRMNCLLSLVMIF